MGHVISGIVTSFRYEDELPSTLLVGNFALLPLSATSEGFRGYGIPPFDELTPGIKRLARDLSFRGACAFIETDYFGGSGTQRAMVWHDGQAVLGPLVEPGTRVEAETSVQRVDAPINEALRHLGIRRHGELDEFDTARLSHFRSNQDVLEEIAAAEPRDAPNP
ncbi:MAG: hypothetical protein AAF560_13980 [Acidobacteriota bacterium]